MQVIPIFPAVIDNSMRKQLVKCQKSAYYKYELGLRSVDAKRVDLHAGGAFAAGITAARRAFFRDALGPENSRAAGIAALSDFYGDFVCPKDSNKSKDRMMGALAFYLDKCPLEDEKYLPLEVDGRLTVEMSFSYPLDISHPDGSTLRYACNFDMLAQEVGTNRVWVIDEKTGSSLGDKWANQWPLDSQMTGYCWGAQKFLEEHGLTNLEVAGAIINGIAIKKYDYEHGRFWTYRPPWQIDRWLAQLKKDVVEWIIAHEDKSHNMALDHACAFYNNPCEFTQLCQAKNPERLYDGNFVVERWDPTKER